MTKRIYSSPTTRVIEVFLNRCILDFSRNNDNNQKPNDNGEESF